MIKGLAVVKSKDGTIVFICDECKGKADYATGEQNRDQLAYILICSKCEKVLGEWTTRDAQYNELRDFTKRELAKT